MSKKRDRLVKISDLAMYRRIKDMFQIIKMENGMKADLQKRRMWY